MVLVLVLVLVQVLALALARDRDRDPAECDVLGVESLTTGDNPSNGLAGRQTD